MIDLEIPMFEGDEKALQQQYIKRNEYWMRLRQVRLEFYDLFEKNANEDFDQYYEWLNKTYGLVPIRDSHGDITDRFRVSNEKLYTLFLLKFS